MTILENPLQTVELEPADLSPEEAVARHELQLLFGAVVGTEVEIMAVQAAMQPFYRSRLHTDVKPVPYQPYEQPVHPVYPEFVEFDSALAITCWFIQKKAIQLDRGDLWINFDHRLSLSEDTIRYLGRVGQKLIVESPEKIVVAKPEYVNEVVAIHNRRVLNPARYPRPVLNVETLAA